MFTQPGLGVKMNVQRCKAPLTLPKKDPFNKHRAFTCSVSRRSVLDQKDFFICFAVDQHRRERANLLFNRAPAKRGTNATVCGLRSCDFVLYVLPEATLVRVERLRTRCESITLTTVSLPSALLSAVAFTAADHTPGLLAL